MDPLLGPDIDHVHGGTAGDKGQRPLNGSHGLAAGDDVVLGAGRAGRASQGQDNCRDDSGHIQQAHDVPPRDVTYGSCQPAERQGTPLVRDAPR